MPFRDTGAFTTAVSHIYGMIRSMDRGVARVLDALEQHGLAENTLVLFTSDNGPQFTGAGEMDSRRFNCGFAGAKLLVYEGGIRVPMIARWPAAFAGGRELHDIVHFTDWLPTLLAAAGVEPPRDVQLDGADVLPLLRGEAGAVQTQRFWQWNRYTPVGECNAAMRDGRWKLVLPAIDELLHPSPADLQIDILSKVQPDQHTTLTRDPEPERGTITPPEPQLFDIDADPSEEHDLAAAQPERVQRMGAQLAAWFEDVEADRRTINDVW